MKIRFWLLCFWLLFAMPAMAQVPFLLPEQAGGRETLEIGTSTNEIAITSDFRGADLTVFGALGNVDQLLLAIGQYDIVVTLEGPRENMTVRRKERLFGIWINRQSLNFDHVPISYSLASTRAVGTIAPAHDLTRLGIGAEYLSLNPVGYLSGPARIGEFQDAFLALQQASGLYQPVNAGVRFVSNNLFRATLKLPANIPDGVHVVHAYLFKSGTFLTEKQLRLRVVKTGLEQAITDAAHNQPLLYGTFSVALALLTGWLASLIFRRD